jgi:hypothetical protein
MDKDQDSSQARTLKPRRLRANDMRDFIATKARSAPS